MILARTFVRVASVHAALAVHHGEMETEDEAEFMLRLGAEHGFPVGEASLGRAVFADWAGDRWTLVYGLGMVTGF